MIRELLGKLSGSSTITLGDLMNIDQGRISRSANCQVQLDKIYHILKPEGIIEKFKKLFLGTPIIKIHQLVLKFIVNSPSGKPYTVIVQMSPDFDMNNLAKNKIKIYCSCQDFKFRSAYFLKKSGSLFENDRTRNNLGEAAVDSPKKLSSNPICKHCYSVINYIINNYQNIMQLV